MTIVFGLQVAGQHPEGLPGPRIFAEIALAAEALGYDSLWVGEHIDFGNPVLEGTSMLGFLAGCTSRVTLGTAVLLLPLRHPALVAKQLASLDHLSGGRVVLGIGVGGESTRDFSAVEVPITERGARTDESIDAIRALWNGPRASHRGRFYAFDDVTLDPRPARGSGLPIWVGGRSERALRRVAERGDGWLSLFMSPEGYARGLATLAREAEGAGRETRDIVRGHCVHTLVDHDGGRAGDRALAHFSARYGRAVEPHVIERYCVVGDPQECQERVGRYAAAGVEHLVFIPMSLPDEISRQVEMLWREVVEPLRAGVRP